MKQLLWSCLFSLPLMLLAQDTLTLDAAIQQALESNYDIRVARYNIESATNNAQPGMAGLLPEISATAGVNYSNSSGSADFPGVDSLTGERIVVTQSASGIETNSQNVGLNLNYTVFSGLANKSNYQILQKNVELTEAQVRAQIEANLIQVINAYYQLARLQANYAVLLESEQASRERINFLRNQFEFGQSNSLAILNAQVDLNTDSVNLAVAEMNMENARRDLNYLMGVDLAQTFSVEKSLNWKDDWRFEELARLAREGNASLNTAAYNRQVSELNLKIAQGGRLPRLDVNASYAYNNSNNGPFSFVSRTQGLGLNAGATLSVPIFTGFRNKVNIQNAEVSVASSNLAYQQAEQLLLLDLQNAYANYQNSMAIYRLQRNNLTAAEANFARTQESFELGQATSLQFREAQLNLQRVRNQINDLRFDVKLNEMELLRLSGQLVE
ncbi:MAG: TolC family protein [Bacteroidota bacterium]